MTLPFHPAALWAPIPTTKESALNRSSSSSSSNATTSALVRYLPTFERATAQLVAGGYFARPLLVGTNRTLAHMFDDPAMLTRMDGRVAAAAAAFGETMRAFGEDVVGARTFGPDGLAQGMPFVWRALDPNVVPWSLTI